MIFYKVFSNFRYFRNNSFFSLSFVTIRNFVTLNRIEMK